MRTTQVIVSAAVLIASMICAGNASAASTSIKPAATNFNPCAAVYNYMVQQCNTPTGPTANCPGAQKQYQACTAGQHK